MSPTGGRQGGGGGFFDSPNNYYNPMMNMMGMGGMGMVGMSGMGGMGGFNMNDWQPTVDPTSGMKFYTNNRSGECVWEQEFKMRVQAASMANQGGGMYPQFGMGQFGAGAPMMGQFGAQGGSQSSLLGNPPSAQAAMTAGGAAGGSQPSQLLDQIVQQKAARVRATELLKKHAPERMSELEELLNKYKGKEEKMITDLCDQYKVARDDEVRAFQSALSDMKTEKKVILAVDTQSNPPPLSDPPRKLSRGLIEHSASFRPGSAAPPQVVVQGVSEQVVQAMMAEVRTKHEAQLEEERANFRNVVSEKEGTISKLQSDLQALHREKASTQVRKCIYCHTRARYMVYCACELPMC
jgi:hypothetical protein